MVIPVGNVLNKFMDMPKAFRQKYIGMARKLAASGEYKEMQELAAELLELILEELQPRW